MSWQAVARKDFRDASRSYWLWGLTVLFVALVTAAAAVLSWIPDAALVFLLGMNPENVGTISTSMVVQGMNGLLVTPLVPLIALVMSHGAISKERESGSLKLLLALPHSREDVVVGKVVGRSATMAVAIAAGFVLPMLVMLVMSLAGSDVAVDVLAYLGYVVMTVGLAVVFVSIGVGISAAVETQFRALILMLSFYLVFIILWVTFQVVGGIALALLAGGWPQWMPLTFSETLDVLKVVNPTGSFKIVTRAYLNDVLFASNPGRRMPSLQKQVSAVLMLLFWAVGPLAVGMYKFVRTDL